MQIELARPGAFRTIPTIYVAPPPNHYNTTLGSQLLEYWDCRSSVSNSGSPNYYVTGWTGQKLGIVLSKHASASATAPTWLVDGSSFGGNRVVVFDRSNTTYNGLYNSACTFGVSSATTVSMFIIGRLTASGANGGQTVCDLYNGGGELIFGNNPNSAVGVQAQRVQYSPAVNVGSGFSLVTSPCYMEWTTPSNGGPTFYRNTSLVGSGSGSYNAVGTLNNVWFSVGGYPGVTNYSTAFNAAFIGIVNGTIDSTQRAALYNRGVYDFGTLS